MILIGPIEIPLILESRANKKDHYNVVGKKAKRQRRPVRDSLRLRYDVIELQQKLRDPSVKLDILLVRIANNELDPWDNLPGSLKSCLDGVCDFLGIDDRSKRLRVYYDQRKPGNKLPGYQAVEITIAERESCPTCDGVPMILWSPERREALKHWQRFIEAMVGMLGEEIIEEHEEHLELACLVSEMVSNSSYAVSVLHVGLAFGREKWDRMAELANKLKVEL